MYQLNFADRHEPAMSEDCLYLNVWTPDPSPGAGLPVMVWIHGGGNRYGYGSQDIHNGARLAGRGIVVVTLNHRLGALGFLAHAELAADDEYGASGNYGLLDIVAALQWVHRNIEAFGGDAAAVTVAGNSAGAAHVTHLMAAPAARGLFRAAIGQSAAGVFRAEGPLPTQEAAQESGRRYAASLSTPTLDDLRRISGLDLVLTGHFGPIIDGRLLRRDTQDVFLAGAQSPVPLLVGSNRDEGVYYTSPGAAAALAERAAGSTRRTDFATAYPTEDGRLRSSARLFVGESRFVYPVWRWARTHVATCGAPTWLYRFEHEPPVPPWVSLPPDGVPGYGAFHTAELPYMSDNLYLRAWDWTGTDRVLATTMADAWAGFVRDLDPNRPGMSTWESITDTDEAPVFVFGPAPHPGTVDRLPALRLLDQLPRPL
jgi:para-nitrobenzyl esterase